MIAVYAGRFDPVTNGHLDILRRAARIFEQVVVAAFDAPSDKTLFPTSQRVSMLQTCVQDMPSVSVEPFEGLLTDFVRAARIREVAALGHDVAHLVPTSVAAALQEIWPLKS